MSWWESFINFSGKEVIDSGSYIFGIVILIAIFALLFFLSKKSKISKGFLSAVIIILVAFSIYWGMLGIKSCVITSDQLAKAANGTGFMNSTLWPAWNWMRGNVLGCGKELGWGGRLLRDVGKVLGFEQTMGDFFLDFLTGFVAGIFLWLIYILAFESEKIGQLFRTKMKNNLYIPGKENMGKLKSSWLSIIASGIIPWKAIVIGAFYAVLLQIPFLKTAIEFITFSKFLGVEIGIPVLIRAIIIAFYFGLLPTAIESYSRYKIRKELYTKLLEVKAGVKAARTLGSQ